MGRVAVANNLRVEVEGVRFTPCYSIKGGHHLLQSSENKVGGEIEEERRNTPRRSQHEASYTNIQSLRVTTAHYDKHLRGINGLSVQFPLSGTNAKV